jgi:hypothetical protein
MRYQLDSPSRRLLALALSLLASLILATPTKAQDTVTGAFEGRITNSRTGAPIAGAAVQFINQATGVPIAKRTDQDGRFYQGLLQPGTYTIRATAPGFKSTEIERRLLATQNNRVIPVPVTLEPETIPSTTTPTTTTTTTTTTTNTTGTTGTTTTTTPTGTSAQQTEEANIESAINQTDARRGGAFTEREVSTLPLGATTLVRSFDELALLLPGVALPPQTSGAAGPGIGPGVGSAGQFAVNGLRSRANNFTVDGSDNNDEDIGVRRQGFFSLIPQPVESIREFQVITLLAPAQFGRNIGAQVNAISKSGTSATHGTIYGFINSSQLNARNTFDTVGGNTNTALTAGGKRVVFNCPFASGVGCPTATVVLNNGDQDSFTLGQGGFVLGGPLDVDHGPGRPGRMFYFVSAEGQILNANKEVSFAVPTIEQRGAFRSGATGISVNPFNGATGVGGFPTTVSGDAIFSFFPFANNPNGIYGANTFTRQLPSSAQGKVVSGKFDASFRALGREHSLTARYNFTDDWRDIPAVGGALFARLRPRVRTQNFSTFLNTELSGPSSTSPVFNQIRLSYGRTRLNFDEGRDTEYLRPVRRRFNNPEEAQFLLNAPFLVNDTLPTSPVVFYDTFDSAGTGETETEDLGLFGNLPALGPIGQINIAGFSPVGVDVFNFPQRRVNNTYQLADTLSMRRGTHSLAFGTDIRRTELISALPRNSRPLLTFNGAPRIIFNPNTGLFSFAPNVAGAPNPYVSPSDFAAAGAPSGVFQSIVLPGRDANIFLRYHQLNFFAQDEWRIRPNFSLSFGLRYEYNTPPKEVNNLIENTFSAALPTVVRGLSNFIDGRSQIFEPDRNNFAPRVGFAYSPDLFGRDHTTVIRAGYGLFYDQILGAVVSQSRNVFPTFTTINFGGGCCDVTGNDPFSDQGFNIFNPLQTFLGNVPIIQPGTLNTLNPALPQNTLINAVFSSFPSNGTGRPFGATLPQRQLETPMAHHYSVTFEQQLSASMVVSAAYVGTLGRNLLRFTSPNLGQNFLVVPVTFTPNGSSFGGGTFSGITLDPGSLSPSATLTSGRPVNTIGPVNIFETSAESRYDALQLQLRGRFRSAFQYQMAYTFSKTEDDVSDVFDLAGAPALPQNSLTFEGERAPSNFDARHRFAYNFIWDFPTFRNRGGAFRAFFGDYQLASTGQFQTGQPFTVNTLYDINLDGNLTDRLNSTTGLVETGNRAQPLQFTGASTFALLAPIGRDGSVTRNTFRAGNVLDLNLAVIKRFVFSEHKNVMLRMDIFNFINRANYGIPVRFLEAPGFGRATDTVTPGRRIQFALKYNF